MNTATYDLTVEPWIPVKTMDGARHHIGLRELFDTAGSIRRVDISDPLERMSVHRLLLAIMYAAHPGCISESDGAALLETGRDGDAVNYLDQWRNRFDLKHPERPFLQTHDLEPSGSDTGRGLAPLHPMLKRPLWAPFGKKSTRVTPDRAAILLLACRSYDVAGIHTGMKGDPNAHAGKSTGKGVAEAGHLFLAWVSGRDLLETLILNMPYDPSRKADDRPAWELDEERPGLMAPLRTGPAIAYTWPSRRVRLLWDEDGLCRGVYQTNGDRALIDLKGVSDPAILENCPNLEPCAFYRQGRKAVLDAAHVTSDFMLGRHLWYEYAMLFDPEYRPRNLDWAARFHDRVTFETLDVIWGQQNAVVSDTRVDHVTVAAERLKDYDACRGLVEDTIKRIRSKTDRLTYRAADAPMIEWLAGGEAPDWDRI